MASMAAQSSIKAARPTFRVAATRNFSSMHNPKLSQKSSIQPQIEY